MENISGLKLEKEIKISPTDAKELGLAFRRKREEKGLSLETVNSDTHISLRYLRAIENGDFSHFPAEVYLTGSLRRYAHYLGLDASKLVATYTGYKLQKIENEKPAADAKKGDRINVMLPFVIIAALLAAGFLLLHTGNRTPGVENKAPVPEKSPAAAVVVPITPQPGELKLEIKATETSWLKVVSDGTMVFEGVLPPGSAREWVAKNEFALKIGYVPGIEVKLNGFDIDVTKGAQQDVNNISLNWDSIK